MIILGRDDCGSPLGWFSRLYVLADREIGDADVGKREIATRSVIMR